MGSPSQVEHFAQWGYPFWFQYLTGIIEVGGGICLFLPKTQWYGIGGLEHHHGRCGADTHTGWRNGCCSGSTCASGSSAPVGLDDPGTVQEEWSQSMAFRNNKSV